jgi:CheY-like chemotaxis protein
MTRTVLIVDDHAPLPGAGQRVAADGGFEVVGEAADARSALEAVGRLRPSVVVLDIQLPDLDGFEVARQLAQAGDPPAIVLVSSRDSSPTVVGWSRARPVGSSQEGPLGSRGRRARRLNGRQPGFLGQVAPRFGRNRDHHTGHRDGNYAPTHRRRRDRRPRLHRPLGWSSASERPLVAARLCGSFAITAMLRRHDVPGLRFSRA